LRLAARQDVKETWHIHDQKDTFNVVGGDSVIDDKRFLTWLGTDLESCILQWLTLSHHY
jgi:hypothetical protein